MRLMTAALAVLLVTGACSSASEPATETASTGGGDATASITGVDNAFEPTELELPAGEEVTVEFTNDGDAPHTFTSEEMGFDTGSVEPGATAEVTFTVPDEDTPFVCVIHEESDDMVGTVVPTS